MCERQFDSPTLAVVMWRQETIAFCVSPNSFFTIASDSLSILMQCVSLGLKFIKSSKPALFSRAIGWVPLVTFSSHLFEYISFSRIWLCCNKRHFIL